MNSSFDSGWRPALTARLAAAVKVAVLGIGSELKSDDAAGMLLIEELARQGLPSERVLLLPGSTAPENFTGVIREFGPDLLLAVDAAHMGLSPGTIAAVAPEDLDGLEFSTHMLPFSVMLRYLREGGLPDALLLGIEPVHTEFGFTASAPVAKAVRELADFLTQNLKGELLMKTLYEGKTKSVLTDEQTGAVYLLFKDDATGENGVFDPGSNTVGGSVEGKGKIGLKISQYFFEVMKSNNIPTHYLGADIDKGLMQVRKLTVPALEFVLRYFTAGSMCRRFTIEEGIAFAPPYLEVTLKDDDQGDPLISERLCLIKGILKEGQYQEALDVLLRVGEVLKKELAKMELTLIDFKIEVGYDENGKIYVVDEITPDIWRVRDKNGKIPNQIDCAKLILEQIN